MQNNLKMDKMFSKLCVHIKRRINKKCFLLKCREMIWRGLHVLVCFIDFEQSIGLVACLLQCWCKNGNSMIYKIPVLNIIVVN